MLIPKPYRIIEESKFKELSKIEQEYHNLLKKNSNEELRQKNSNQESMKMSPALNKEGHGHPNPPPTLQNLLTQTNDYINMTSAPNTIPEEKEPDLPKDEEYLEAINREKKNNDLEETQSTILQSKLNIYSKVPQKSINTARNLMTEIQKFHDSIYDENGNLILNSECLPNSNISEILGNIYDSKISIKKFYKVSGLSELCEFISKIGLNKFLPAKINHWVKKSNKLPRSSF